MTHVRSPRIFPRLWSLLALIGLLAGCSPAPEDRVAELVPGIPARSAAVLLHGSDDELCGYYGEAGHDQIRAELDAVIRAIRGGTAAERRLLLPLMDRLGWARAEVYGVRSGVYLCDFYRSLDEESLDRVAGLVDEFERMRHDNGMSDRDKMLRQEEILASARELGAVFLEVVVLSSLAQMESNRGDDDRAFAMFSEALRLSESVGFVGMACQNLGTLATIARRNGRPDEADAFLDRMAELARETGFGKHASRAEAFRGMIALDEGRLHTAYLHLQEARDLSRRLKAGWNEARFILDLVDFYRTLGAWEIVADLAGQVPAFDLDPADPVQALFIAKSKKALAEARHGQGDPEAALALSHQVLDEIAPRPFPQEFAASRTVHGRLLLAAGRYDEAADFVLEALRQAVHDGQERYERGFRLLLAEAREGQGRTREALEILREVRTDLDDPDAEYPQDARDEALLGLRLARAEHGDGPELAEALVRAFRLMQHRLTASPPSAHTYLELQGWDEVRWFVHEQIADDAVLGYEFDMAWRGLTEVAKLGLTFPPEASFSGIHEAVGAFVDLRFDGDRGRLRTTAGPIHLVYVVTESEIWRWTRDGRSVARDVLDWEPGAMREAAASAARQLSTPPPAGVPGVSRELQEALEELCRRLVPAAVTDGGGEVRVSADDALTRLPFATFDKDAGDDYEPLAAALSLVNLRYIRTGEHPCAKAGDNALVLGDPVIAEAWARRFNGLAPLPHARREALRAAELLSAREVLLGSDVAKTRIRAAWASASTIYFAGHVVRNENVPYLTLIPLAEEPRTTRPADEILEAADILQADLACCGLVVLSGCSSGAPYVDGSLSAPGLGDAFLDAGASHVVQTLWQIEDDEALPVMIEVLAAMLVNERDEMRPADGWRRLGSVRGTTDHPYFWGSYKLSTIVPD